MRLTAELVKEHGACEEGVNYLKEHYPNGAEILELADDPNIPLEWVHDARKYVPFTPEEVKRYEELCNVVNSTYTRYSSDITNSANIISSTKVTDSKQVVQSNGVKDSQYIYRSDRIDFSKNVMESTDVTKSASIISSKNITRCTNIVLSDYISRSENILYSLLITSSSYCYKSKDLFDCYFCGFCAGLKHCMFCSNLEDEEYCIFNKKVSRALYEQIREELFTMLNAEASNFVEVKEDKLLERSRFVYDTKFNSIFKGLSDDFREWISELPNYSDEMYNELFL